MEYKFLREATGYLRIDPLPTVADLSEYYSSDYYQNPHGTYSSDYTPSELRHKRIRNEFLFKVSTELVEKDSQRRFLDVGCGEGFLIDTFNSNGWSTLGLDFSAFGVAKFNSHLVSNLIVGDVYNSINQLVMNESKFDCINLGNILEHVLNPMDLIATIKRLMGHGSSILITVPNDFSPLQSLLKESKLIQKDYWVAPPDHLNYFSHLSLIRIAQVCGLVPQQVYADFPIEWFLFNENSNYQLDPTLGKSAHRARVALDSFITSDTNFEMVKNFWAALANIGQGRNISLLATMEENV